MKNHYFNFNGTDSTEFKVGIYGTGVFNAPKRSVDTVKVPGRNGALTIDNGYYENISVTYPCYIVEDFQENIDALRAFLMANHGYKRLEDSIHPNEYRIGRLSKEIDVDVKGVAKAGEFDLVFDCKPQRFLKSGEATTSITTSGTIFNPTRFNAKPLIRVHGTGTLTIGDYSITIDSALTQSYVDLDCELMDAYYGSINLNNYVSGDFPELVPGANEITYDGTIDITPNWWTL